MEKNQGKPEFTARVKIFYMTPIPHRDRFLKIQKKIASLNLAEKSRFPKRVF